MLEGDDPGGGAFALCLRPHPGAYRQLMCPHPGEFAHLLQKNANARGLAQGGGMGTAGIDCRIQRKQCCIVFFVHTGLFCIKL